MNHINWVAFVALMAMWLWGAVIGWRAAKSNRGPINRFMTKNHMDL